MDGRLTTTHSDTATRRAGFTLVELLVVIGIIALLIGILMPALNRARASARDLKCLSNLHSLGQAFTIYGLQNRNVWPRPGRPAVAVPDYWHQTYIYPVLTGQQVPAAQIPNHTFITDTVFECPSARDVWRTTDEIDLTYGMAARLNDEKGSDEDSGRAKFKRPGEVLTPSQTVVLIDSEGAWSGTLTGQSPAGYASQRNRLQKGALRHHGALNALFVDMHAERIPSFDAVPKATANNDYWRFWTGTVR